MIGLFKGKRIRRRTLATMTLGTGLVLVSAGTVVGFHGSTSPADIAAIKQVVYGSQLEEQVPCVPPAQTGNRIAVLPQAAVNAMDKQIQTEESKFYTGSFLTGQIQLLQTNCTANVTEGESMVIDGSVKAMTFTDITVVGDTASVNAHEVKWVKSLIKTARGQETIEPSGLVNLRDFLVKTTDGWRITNEAFQFAPGQGP